MIGRADCQMIVRLSRSRKVDLASTVRKRNNEKRQGKGGNLEYSGKKREKNSPSRCAHKHTTLGANMHTCI